MIVHDLLVLVNNHAQFQTKGKLFLAACFFFIHMFEIIFGFFKNGYILISERGREDEDLLQAHFNMHIHLLDYSSFKYLHLSAWIFSISKFVNIIK